MVSIRVCTQLQAPMEVKDSKRLYPEDIAKYKEQLPNEQ